MSTQHGIKGVVKVGSVTVAEVQEWTYSEEDPAPLQQLSMGDTTETPVASGAKRGSGTVSCLMDISDSTGQGALTTGATVTLHLMTAATGGQDNTGSVVIRNRSKGASKDAFMTINFGFEGVLSAA